jgi:hypothetical protein
MQLKYRSSFLDKNSNLNKTISIYPGSPQASGEWQCLITLKASWKYDRQFQKTLLTEVLKKIQIF